MSSSKVISFMKTPIVIWIKTFQEESDSSEIDLRRLFDGIFLHSVWKQIETNGSFDSHTSIDENDDSYAARIRNLSSLLYKIRTFYHDSLGQVLLLKLPDIVNIGRNPEDDCNLEDLRVLLLLLLGSAVQCEGKERFIEQIKSLDLSVQHSIVDCIQQITDNPSSVWLNNEWSDLSLIPEVDQARMYSTLVQNVNRLVKERDELVQRVVELVLEIECIKSKGDACHHQPHHNHHHSHHHHAISSLPPSPSAGPLLASSSSSPPPLPALADVQSAATPSVSLYNSYSSSSVSSLLTLNGSPNNNNNYNNSNSESRSHLVVELAEAKSKYRKVQAELEEKNELVSELKENLEQSKETCNKLRQENLELIQEARSAKAYRDEIDVLNERVRKVDRLENEVQRYRDKINELIFYKSRVEEMREDNRILTETKSMLEEQLESSRKRSEQIPELEAQILQLRAYSNEISFQRDMDKDKIESLMEEVTSLQVEKKAVLEELAQVQKEFNTLRCQFTAMGSTVNQNGLESNLFEQLNNDAAKRVLKLELENQKLHSLVENIKNKQDFGSLISNNLLNKGISLDSYSSPSSPSTTATTTPLNEGKSDLDDGIYSHETASSSSGNDSGCVSLVGELNSRLEKMERENVRIKSTIGQLRESETRINELETSKSGLEKELNRVKDNWEKEAYKNEQLERNVSNLMSENSRLVRQVESLTKRLEDCSQEIQALEGENAKLQGTSTTLRSTVKRLNDLERDVTHLEGENHRLEQEKKSSEKEILRLRQALEAKDSLIDDQANKLSSLELDKKQLVKELETSLVNAANVKDLEKENKELTGELSVCKKSLAALRQDLVEEKIKSQSLTSEMERIHYAMSQLSLKSSPSCQQSSIPPISPSNIGKTDWPGIFEDLLDGMIRKSLEAKETRITALEESLKQVEGRKAKLKDELQAMKEKIKKSQICHDKESLESSLDKMIEEMEKRLKLAEEENKVLRSENSTLHQIGHQLKEQIKSLQDKIECMSRESNDLHSDQAKAQVENSLLLAQKTSLSSQTANLQAEIRFLEECRDSVEEKYKELEESYQLLINDHQSLQGLHQQLANDYEVLLENHNSLKAGHKQLKAEHKEAKEKLEVWLLSNEELKRIIKDGNDCGKCKKLTEESAKLAEEKKVLLEDYRRIETEFKMLQNIYKQLRKENNELKLRHTELEGETAECRQSMSSLQVKVSKLSNYCESLAVSNNCLDEQRRSLICSVCSLLAQYHLLLSEMAGKDNDNHSRDRIADLSAKRERLERMIKDYDTMAERERKKIGVRDEVNDIRTSQSHQSLNGGSLDGDEERLNNGLSITNSKPILTNSASKMTNSNSNLSISNSPGVLSPSQEGNRLYEIWQPSSPNTTAVNAIVSKKSSSTSSSSSASQGRRENPIGGEANNDDPHHHHRRDSPPPRPPPRHNLVTTQVDNRMTINMITSPGSQRATLPGDSVLTPPHHSKPCNFVRSTFRSNSINMGSPLRRCTKEDHSTFNQLATIRSPHHLHHYHHHHHPHHLHLSSYSNEPSIHSEEESEFDERLCSNNLRGGVGHGHGTEDPRSNPNLNKDETTSTISANNSINNSTWYEYGCV